METAKEFAEKTISEIQAHVNDRAELEKIVIKLEKAAKHIDKIFDEIEPAFTKCLESYPCYQRFKDKSTQSEYNDLIKTFDGDMERGVFHCFKLLNLRYRLPTAMDVIRRRVNRGLNHILNAADKRF